MAFKHKDEYKAQLKCNTFVHLLEYFHYSYATITFYTLPKAKKTNEPI